VRFRELDVLLPQLDRMNIEVQLVTSAVREIPKEWSRIENLHLAVSIDGLQPEHDVRRAPATYDRILKNIEGHSVIVHCTVTGLMLGRQNYFEEFLSFWSSREEVRKIWFSLFTPQKGAQSDEIIPHERKVELLKELAGLRAKFPKLDLPDSVIAGYLSPPASPDDCIFSRITLNMTADLQSRITPCQFGGTPDCSQCGCMASAGLNAVGDFRFLGLVTLRSLFNVSNRVGELASMAFDNQSA
jgi:sulfatase maturation enzyme AslB (radical SAM superfamily)